MTIYEYKMPSLGADMDQGKLVKWLIHAGDKIEKGDLIAEIETPKANIEIETWKSGIVKKLLVDEGVDVKVGGPMVILETSQEIQNKIIPKTASSEKTDTTLLTPRAKKIIHDHQLDLEDIKSKFPNKIITGNDIMVRDESKTKGDKTLPSLNDRQKIIAALMQKSKSTIPHFYLEKQIDVSKVILWMQKKNEFIDHSQRLLPIVFFIKAIALALQKFPVFNSHFTDEQIIANDDVHIGIIISLRQGGLVAPAISFPERKGILSLMQEFRNLVERVRNDTHIKLSRTEMLAATISLTSLGDKGADKVFGVIYPPQVCIIGIGAIKNNSATWTLSADHRVTDAHQGSLFLEHISDILQHPEQME